MNKIKLTKNTYTKGEVKELILQALELAAENAESYCEYDRDILTGISIIDKQSILNTINQVI